MWRSIRQKKRVLRAAFSTKSPTDAVANASTGEYIRNVTKYIHNGAKYKWNAGWNKILKMSTIHGVIES